eukprot:2092580-Pleurochrysis_carterae.AAC.1
MNLLVCGPDSCPTCSTGFYSFCRTQVASPFNLNKPSLTLRSARVVKEGMGLICTSIPAGRHSRLPLPAYVSTEWKTSAHACSLLCASTMC